MNPSQVNRNKNPLLSCAVTGGFEEFTSSGFVLAAAGKLIRSKHLKNPSLLLLFFLLFCTQSIILIVKTSPDHGNKHNIVKAKERSLNQWMDVVSSFSPIVSIFSFFSSFSYTSRSSESIGFNRLPTTSVICDG